MSKRDGSVRQLELVPRSKRATIDVEPTHRLVELTDRLDWGDMEARAELIRASKLKSAAGRPPHLRALLGAMLLMATRKMSYRDAEDQIRYYAPARYLCGLTETDWTPDFTTIQDFTELMGEEGIGLINEYAVELAVAEKLADPKVVAADTTAQEAAIPWPNEMGLMASFFSSVTAASKRGGQALKAFAEKVSSKLKAAKEKVRKYRLFAKTKQMRLELLEEMANLVESTQVQLGRALLAGAGQLRGYSKAARAKAQQLHATMEKLLPQIRYWLRTGWVAKDKIINLHIPELYAIVRGKIGKTVEFGLQWGITRLRGGYLLATLAKHRNELVDARFAVRAVRDHIQLFGEAPRAYAYDRAGHSQENVEEVKALGVKQVALAPRGQSKWAVSDKVRRRMVKERAEIEAGIGAVKSGRYGFHRPPARSMAMMGACGQRAVLGFNLNKLIRQIAGRDELALVG
jgi:hypothetical protein